MKKIFFSICALAAVVVGCNKSEMVNAPGRGVEIDFNAYFAKAPLTKAISADADYLKTFTSEATPAFHVNGFLHTEITGTGAPAAEGGAATIQDSNLTTISVSNAYMNKNVWWDVDDEDQTKGTWDYPGVTYWPDASSGRKLAFSAYGLNAQTTAPENGTADIVFEGNSLTQFTYNVPTVVSQQKDLIVTPFLPNQGIEPNGTISPVQLNFKHLLSRIGFSLISNQDEESIKIDIKKIVLHGTFATSGTVNLKSVNPVLVTEGATTTASYNFFGEGSTDICQYSSSDEAQPIYANSTMTAGENGSYTVAAKADGNSNNRFMMIAPTAATAGSYIEVVYQLTEAEEQTARVDISTIAFVAGTSYDFVFKVSTSAIGFEVTVTPWAEHFTTGDNSTTNPTGSTYTLTPYIEDAPAAGV